jgi:hypothetical protein
VQAFRRVKKGNTKSKKKLPTTAFPDDELDDLDDLMGGARE